MKSTGPVRTADNRALQTEDIQPEFSYLDLFEQLAHIRARGFTERGMPEQVYARGLQRCQHIR